MDLVEARRIERVINRELGERFPDGAVLRAVLRQHDDDPAIEPDQLMVRVLIPGIRHLDRPVYVLPASGPSPGARTSPTRCRRSAGPR